MSDDLVKKEFLIFKAGRGWYRAESQGYTSFKFDAGRYAEDEARAITHPNGIDGPRDGMFYKHESQVSDYPTTRIEELQAALADAIEKLGKSEYARGQAEGKLAASEMAGVVDGWKSRAEAAESKLAMTGITHEASCAGCGKMTTGKCWTDCGMSLCGAPLCDNCRHVDEKYGWRHEPRTAIAELKG